MSRHEDNRHFAGERRASISLLKVWPDLAATLAVDERRIVKHTLRIPLSTAHDEEVAEAFAAETGDVSWLAVVDGTVLKETTLATRSALELFGPGDLLAPPFGKRNDDQWKLTVEPTPT